MDGKEIYISFERICLLFRNKEKYNQIYKSVTERLRLTNVILANLSLFFLCILMKIKKFDENLAETIKKRPHLRNRG